VVAMKTLVLRYKETYIVCDFPMHKRFVDYLKYSIPKSKRSFDGSKWRVMPSALGMVVRFGRLCFDHVDYSRLPANLQIRIADTKYNSESDILEDHSPRALLGVTDEAPMEVVKAAYKALARKYHPDVSDGDDTLMKQLNAAYKSICGDTAL